MEGVFWNFCERIGIAVSIGKQNVMQEACLHNILESKEFQKYFHEDDMLFFEYLFANDGGINLRNNVAHCFYRPEEYNHDKMLLLIAALLRIGKYNYTDNNS